MARLTPFAALMVASSICGTKAVQLVGCQDLALDDLDQGKARNWPVAERPHLFSKIQFYT